MGRSAKVKRNKKTCLSIDIIAYNPLAKLSQRGEIRASSPLLLGASSGDCFDGVINYAS
jgi:hypothetical protein